VDFLFESLFGSPLPHLAWSGGNGARRFDLEAPLFPISPSPAFVNTLRGIINSHSDELEAVISKGKRLFSYYGVDISNTERRQLES